MDRNWVSNYPTHWNPNHATSNCICIKWENQAMINRIWMCFEVECTKKIYHHFLLLDIFSSLEENEGRQLDFLEL